MNKSNKPEGVTADNPPQTNVGQAASPVETPEEKKRLALAAPRARRWPLPPGYRFDREEANSR